MQQGVFGVIAGSTAYFVTVAALTAYDRSTVPVSRPSLGLAVFFLVASGVALMIQVNHTLQLIRLEVILIRVSSITRETFERVMAALEDMDFELDAPVAISETAIPVIAHKSGYVTYEDIQSLMSVIHNHRYTIRLDVEIGGFAVKGTVVGWLQPNDGNGAVPEAVMGQVLNSMGIDGWRNPKVDVGLGLRLMVDIAIKALSPSVNDPYTAATAIDHIAEILVYFANRPLGDKTLLDSQGQPKIQLRSTSLLEYLDQAVDQIARYGSGEPLVIQRLLRLTRDVGLAVDSRADKEHIMKTKNGIVAQAERRLDDPQWLEGIRKLSAQIEESVMCGPGPEPGDRWPVGI